MNLKLYQRVILSSHDNRFGRLENSEAIVVFKYTTNKYKIIFADKRDMDVEERFLRPI